MLYGIADAGYKDIPSKIIDVFYLPQGSAAFAKPLLNKGDETKTSVAPMNNTYPQPNYLINKRKNEVMRLIMGGYLFRDNISVENIAYLKRYCLLPFELQIFNPNFQPYYNPNKIKSL